MGPLMISLCTSCWRRVFVVDEVHGDVGVLVAAGPAGADQAGDHVGAGAEGFHPAFAILGGLVVDGAVCRLG